MIRDERTLEATCATTSNEADPSPWHIFLVLSKNGRLLVWKEKFIECKRVVASATTLFFALKLFLKKYYLKIHAPEM